MNQKTIGCDKITSEQPSAWLGHRQFANWLVQTIKPEITVDLGVDFGHSTFYLAESGIGQVTGVDSFEGDGHAGFRNTYEYAKSIKDNFEFDNVTFIKGYFDNVAKEWNQQIDILHIDGFHTHEAVQHDYETWKGFLKPTSVVLFHDTESFPNDVGRFFHGLSMPKFNFTHSAGLGVLSLNQDLIKLVEETWSV